MMPDPTIGEMLCWAFVLGALAFFVTRRLGTAPAVVVALLAAIGTKAALLNLT